MVCQGDMVITMGAGDVTEIGRLIIDNVQEKLQRGTFCSASSFASGETDAS